MQDGQPRDPGPTRARPEHWRSVSALIRFHGLPLDGASEHFENFVVVLSGEQVIGAAGLEVYGDVGLLRSVAVRQESAKRGLGTRLTLSVLVRARALNLRAVYLLTTTAAEFFAQKGFRRVERALLPTELNASRELQGACPATAVAMWLPLTPS